jgi:hypothetical protein
MVHDNNFIQGVTTVDGIGINICSQGQQTNKGHRVLDASVPPTAEIGWIVSTSLNPQSPPTSPPTKQPHPPTSATVDIDVCHHTHRTAIWPSDADAGSGVQRNIVQHCSVGAQPVSACLDDNNDDDLLYLCLRPQNIDLFCDDDNDNNNINDDTSGRADISWNNNSAAYTVSFCIAILLFDGTVVSIVPPP